MQVMQKFSGAIVSGNEEFGLKFFDYLAMAREKPP